MKLIPYSVNSSSGYTLPELMIAMFLGLVVGSLMLSSTLSSKKVYQYDLKRISIDQNLRSGMDILSASIRVAGENLPTSFPAVEIIDGSNGAADELVIRRNLLDEVLQVCSAVTSGSGNQQVYFAVAGATSSACTYSGQAHNYAAWSAYRSANGGSVKAFIYDVSAKVGEFFSYSNEGNTGSAYYVLRGSGTWQHSYPVASSSVYILEEWRIKLVNGVLTIEEDGDTATVQNVVAGLTDLQARAQITDGSWKSSFDRTEDWSDITALEVTLTSTTSFQKKSMTRSLSARLFPRNILSK